MMYPFHHLLKSKNMQSICVRKKILCILPDWFRGYKICFSTSDAYTMAFMDILVCRIKTRKS